MNEDGIECLKLEIEAFEAALLMLNEELAALVADSKENNDEM
jgi:hypothetical protein